MHPDKFHIGAKIGAQGGNKVDLSYSKHRPATICVSTSLYCRILPAEHLSWFIIWKLKEKKDKLFVEGFKRMEFRMAGTGPKTGPGP